MPSTPAARMRTCRTPTSIRRCRIRWSVPTATGPESTASTSPMPCSLPAAHAVAGEAGGTEVIGRTLRRLAAGALPLLATLALAELVLRTFPAIVPISVGTAIYSVYTTAPGDIYFLDVPTRATFMCPDFHTRAYWNGYVWDHRTDARGFRNPPELHDPALVWLGDSMIYGHGVEERDTAAAQLRSAHGIAAYNAGRQADCLYQEYLRH